MLISLEKKETEKKGKLPYNVNGSLINQHLNKQKTNSDGERVKGEGSRQKKTIIKCRPTVTIATLSGKLTASIYECLFE